MPAIVSDLVGQNVCSFLDLIRFSEGTATSPITQNAGYDIIVTAEDLGRTRFSDFTKHPFDDPKRPGTVLPGRLVRVGPPKLYSTAAGGYQLLYRYWAPYLKQLNLNGFYPEVQDQIAIQQIKEQKALDLIDNGKISAAIAACSNIWASMPGNNYGQNPHSVDVLLAKYEELGGEIT